MNFQTPSAQIFLWRGMFGASVVYLIVALVLLSPTGWFGLAHCVWAVICVIGSWRVLRAARAPASGSQERRASAVEKIDEA